VPRLSRCAARACGTSGSTDGPRLAELAALVDAGQLTPRVAATLPMEQVATAHQRVADGGLRGRIVLTLDG
jgi:NADPH2:quinone reductase